MLDGLLNRGFSSKCKSLMKATKTRIDVVRRRAEAKQRFLKEDLAKLLANGFDVDAYGRTEEFIAGLNILSCYDFLEYACEYVVKQLSSMQKQSECPEECREPVASLMYAAARFSDLPELRDLRDLFQERYGSTLECFVNQKFVEKLSSRPPVMEKRLQLLKDVATEFSINWDSRGFEQRMAAPPPLAQAQPNKHGPSTVGADKHNLLNGDGSVRKPDRYDVSLKEAYGHSSGGPRMHRAREGKDSKKDGSSAVAKYDKYDVSPEQTSGNDGPAMHNGRGAKESKREDADGVFSIYDRHDVLPEGTRALSNGSHKIHNSIEDMKSRREGVSFPVSKSDRYDVSHKETLALINDGHRMHNGREGKDLRREELGLCSRGRQGSRTDGHTSPTRGKSTSRRVKNDLLFEERQEAMVDKQELSCKNDDTLFKAVKSGTSSRRKGLDNAGSRYSGQDDGSTNMHDGESWDGLSLGKSKISPSCRGFPGRNEDIPSAHEHGREKNLENSKKVIQEDDVLPPPYIKSKNNALPPPYIKPKDHKYRPSRKSEQAGPYSNGHSTDPSANNRVNEERGSNWMERVPDYPVPEVQDAGLGRIRSHHRHKEQYHQNDKVPLPHHQKEHYYQEDKVPLPKPRSVRRRQQKSSSNHDDITHVQEAGSEKRSSSSRRRDNSRRGLQILFDDEHSRNDEEERMIDKLLLHYSTKPSTYDEGRMRKVSQAHSSHQVSNATGEPSYDPKRDGHNLSPDVGPTTVRSISLPREETKPSGVKKVFTRANSFQPDGQAPHVHPKLPDYDDLAARFAALKGR